MQNQGEPEVMGVGQTRFGSGAARLTPSERWAIYVAQHASGVVGALIALAVAAAFITLAAFQDALVLWGLGVMMVLVASVYWERSGFKRLLARRDEEIEHLRSRGRSA